MSIYEGILFLKRNPTLLDICAHHCNGTAYLSNKLGYNYEIRINEELSDNERIKTLIHEILHFSRKFRCYLGERLSPDNPIEVEINRLSEVIFNNQPILSKFLKSRLEAFSSKTEAFKINRNHFGPYSY